VDWVKLSIIKTNKGEFNDLVGTVEFKAFYLDQYYLFVLHEGSHFVKNEDRWFYAFGHHTDPLKLKKFDLVLGHGL
jgi:SEC-C motif-containing protein